MQRPCRGTATRSASRSPDVYRKLFDSDAVRFGGSGYNGQNDVEAAHGGDAAQPLALRLNLPPLAAMFFVGPAQ